MNKKGPMTPALRKQAAAEGRKEAKMKHQPPAAEEAKESPAYEQAEMSAGGYGDGGPIGGCEHHPKTASFSKRGAPAGYANGGMARTGHPMRMPTAGFAGAGGGQDYEVPAGAEKMPKQPAAGKRSKFACGGSVKHK